MNSKMDGQIVSFMNSVKRYLKMEYHKKYCREFSNENTINNLYDFIGSYYMGGSTVPETARYVADFMDQILWKQQ